MCHGYYNCFVQLEAKQENQRQEWSLCVCRQEQVYISFTNLTITVALHKLQGTKYPIYNGNHGFHGTLFL